MLSTLIGDALAIHHRRCCCCVYLSGLRSRSFAHLRSLPLGHLHDVRGVCTEFGAGVNGPVDERFLSTGRKDRRIYLTVQVGREKSTEKVVTAEEALR